MVLFRLFLRSAGGRLCVERISIARIRTVRDVFVHWQLPRYTLCEFIINHYYHPLLYLVTEYNALNYFSGASKIQWCRFRSAAVSTMRSHNCIPQSNRRALYMARTDFLSHSIYQRRIHRRNRLELVRSELNQLKLVTKQC